MSNLRYSLLVCTMNRPESLYRCVRRVLEQTILPEEIIIIDDGALDVAELREILGVHAGRLVYRRKDAPGLAASYHLGADLCRSPWLLSLDDDIFLSRGFVQELASAMKGREKDLGALTGYPVQRGASRIAAKRLVRRVLDRAFLLGGGLEGRFFSSSFCTDFQRGWHLNTPYRVRHAPSGLVLWNADVLRAERFDEWFAGYGYGVDKELALRVSKNHRIYCVPAARALHDKDPGGRLPSEKLGRMKLRNQFFIFRRHFAHGVSSWLSFAWALTGLFIIAMVGIVSGPNRNGRLSELRGMLSGLADGVRG